jgi:hypothetical protein
VGNWIGLSRSQHTGQYWRPREGFQFAAALQVVPILVIELNKLLPHYVLGFMKVGETFEPIALLGLGGERNVYVNTDGKWLGGYTPAALRAYPFTLASSTSDEKILCIDSAHLTQSKEAKPLFNSTGEIADEVQEMLSFLKNTDANMKVTQAATRALAEAQLFEDWPLKVNKGEDIEPMEIRGLYRIKETALNMLDAEAFAALREFGALPLAYAQLFSMSQLEQLGQRAEFIGNQLKATQSTDLNFLAEDRGVLNFDSL